MNHGPRSAVIWLGETSGFFARRRDPWSGACPIKRAATAIRRSRPMKIDDRLRGHAAKVPNPVPFRGVNGEVKGWKVSVPGARPLATPAISNSRLFLGGGFGSYEFYAFDATYGRFIWQYQTEYDGPTAAVVANYLVCFNTESCELEVL